MNTPHTTGRRPLSEQFLPHDTVDQFTEAWQLFLDGGAPRSERPSVEKFLKDCPANDREALFWELLNIDMRFRKRWGKTVDRELYEVSFRDIADVYKQVVCGVDESVDDSILTTSVDVSKLKNAVNANDRFEREPVPERIGRYKVRCLIDTGGFGRVYRAHDAQLDRDVAIKVPRKHRAACRADQDLFFTEARIVARLEHTHIVPVHDAGLLDDGRCYVVSKWIEGSNLAAVIKRERPSYEASAQLVAKIATALQVAHRQKITHRDIKPANILIDSSGEPFLTDFGLAVKQDDFGGTSSQGMTPAYASPEQARGESHLVDGRSDVFSLGVVLYELLTGQRPFTGKTTIDVISQILAVEPIPPQQLASEIPQELGRICLKALAKRATDRYATAYDFAADLSHFLREPNSVRAAADTPNIFISYRREDSLAFVHRLCERLQTRYGDDAVFLDMLSLKHGLDFCRQIDKALQRCNVVLAVIGPEWLGAKHDGPRRIDDEHDYVRIEVETALACGLPVVPVLVGSTPMPDKRELPESLKALSFRHACSIDAGPNLDVDVQRLIDRTLDTLDHATRDSISPTPTPTPTPTATPTTVATLIPTPTTAPSLNDTPTKVFPKGLCSFDESDADFFLRLLPGPTNRDGLTESITFWKTRIDQHNPEQPLRVGLLYGPSGCGKSSLIKAGLLPRLADHVAVTYIESTAADTETRLLHRLSSLLPNVPDEWDLVTAFAALRCRKTDLANKRILIVLDQFEQWLQAHRGEGNAQLLQALRQCDGQNVQALLMVRDEYWMPATRFMEQLEIPLIQAQNFAAVDLFDALHARKVLIEFGRGYGRLSEDPSGMSGEESAFLDQVVADLTDQDGKIVSVQLALFAEMVKSKPWTPSTLETVGGAKGVGVTFLKETFTGTGAPPRHRLHQIAARAVMKQLLPESGSHIKGGMRSESSLQVASGYTGRKGEFDELMRILNTETRLVTPVDPEGYVVENGDDLSETPLDPGQRYYQFTHDYLVPSVRKWLNAEDQATRSGRAQIRLDERTEAWAGKQDNRQLPTFSEAMSIWLFAHRKDWTKSQRNMMKQARRYFGQRGLLVASLFVVAAWIGIEVWGRIRVDALLNASTDNVLRIAASVGPSIWARTQLRGLAKVDAKSLQQQRNRLHARLALVHSDDSQIKPLLEDLYRADLPFVGVIGEAVGPFRSRFIEEVWSCFHDPARPVSQRFRAGLVLATLDSESDHWTGEDAKLLIDQFVSSIPNSTDDLVIISHLRNIETDRLLPPLEQSFISDQSSVRFRAAILVKSLAVGHSEYIGKLVVRATADQFAILYELIEDDGEIGECLTKQVRKRLGGDLTKQDRIARGRKRAVAAIGLLRTGELTSIADIFRVTDDPESLTQFVHRCKKYGVTPDQLVDCLKEVESRWNREQPDHWVYGLLLALGEFEPSDLPMETRERLVDDLENTYAAHPSSAIHGASCWLLRRWREGKRAGQIDRTQRDESPTREWFVTKIPDPPEAGENRVPFDHYTFIIFDDAEGVTEPPLSPTDQSVDRFRRNAPTRRRFAVMDREVTLRQWRHFETDTGREHNDSRGRRERLPVRNVTWQDATKFCDWLTRQSKMDESDTYYDSATARPDRHGFRLLTVAEWEYACKSGTRTEFGFGNDRELLVNYGWFETNTYAADGTDAPRRPGMLRPNLHGVFDLHGNVYEWCDDRDSNPRSPNKRAVRGGAYNNTPRYLKSTISSGIFYGTGPANNRGFRVARTLP